jgi:ATP-dependent Clp protease ATP-binding subunit ClpC
VDLKVTVTAVRQRVEDVIGRGVHRPGAHLRFALAAQRVIERALAEVQRQNHRRAGVDDLLLRLLDEPDSAASRVLATFGTDVDQLRRRILDTMV